MKSILNIFYFLTIASNFPVFAQKASLIDSLMTALKTADADTSKVNCLNLLSSQFRNKSNYNNAMTYADTDEYANKDEEY